MVRVAFAWVSRLLQSEFPFITTAVRLTSCILETDFHAFAYLIFALSFGLCAYNFFCAMTVDPGTYHTPKSDAELKSVVVLIRFVYIIEDLASEG